MKLKIEIILCILFVLTAWAWADKIAEMPDWIFESNQADANAGFGLSSAGDVNGDGFSDLIIGVHNYGNSQDDEGRVYIFMGQSGGLPETPGWFADSGTANAQFGHAISTAGDVNGDGYDDVIIGAHYYEGPKEDEGKAYLFYGSNAGPGAVPEWTTEGNQSGAEYGHSVATAGDVNGDGFSDVLIGSPNYYKGQAFEGMAFCFYGSASGLAVTADWTFEANQSYAHVGFDVAGAGDVNGDGYDDAIISASNYSNGETNEGRAFVFYGSASGLSNLPDWTAESDQASAFFGQSVAGAGDVNGDGYDDVIVSAHFYDNDQLDEGRVFLYYGSAAGLSQQADWTGEQDQADGFFGFTIAGAGDVNEDGFDDILIGAPFFDNETTGLEEGAAFLYLGSANGLSQSPDWSAMLNQEGAFFGVGVSSCGDVNGDGADDIVIGATGYDNGQEQEGGTFVYYGDDSGDDDDDDVMDDDDDDQDDDSVDDDIEDDDDENDDDQDTEIGSDDDDDTECCGGCDDGDDNSSGDDDSSYTDDDDTSDEGDDDDENDDSESEQEEESNDEDESDEESDDDDTDESSDDDDDDSGCCG